MSSLLVFRERMKMLYARHSVLVEKGMQFALGLLLFGLINANIGYMKAASSLLCTVGLAVISTFFPVSVTVIVAVMLVLLHFSALSMPVTAVSFVLFLLMYIFYFRFTPKKAWLLLLSAIAFALKIPFVIPVAFGLLGTPSWCVPAACGTMAYYIVHYVKSSAAALKGIDASGMTEVLISFTKQVLSNKEMWLMMLTMMLGVLVVNVIRMRALNQAWKAASAVGAAVCVVSACAGSLALGLHVDWFVLAFSAALGILLGIVLEILFFSVDYSRTENIQFEDDEYYYYVKAIPKVGVPVPEKTVKHITGGAPSEGVSQEEQNEGKRERRARSTQSMEEALDSAADEILLTRSLSKELGLDSDSTPRM